MVNIYKQKLTLLQQEVLRVLFVRAGKPLNARRIANLLEVSQPAVAKALPMLRELDLITMEQDKESKRWAIALNRENKDAIDLKRADNLKQLYDSGFVKWIWNNFPGATAILFGSYALGEDTTNSDIDIAVIGSEEKTTDERFDKILERTVSINYYKSFKSINHLLLSNILNGITLKGVVDL